MKKILESLGLSEVNNGATSGSSRGWIKTTGSELVCRSPIDGSLLATVRQATAEEYEIVAARCWEAFLKWRTMPAPKRGLLVREIGEALREKKKELAALVTLEAGKIVSEGAGEVQEMIDMADFAVGLSRQLYGLTMASERPNHRMFEQWLPLGPVGVISSFNFPVSVWSWNALLAAVCGDSVLWKPSSRTPLTAIAVQNIIAPIVDKYDMDGLFSMVIGKRGDVGNRLGADKRFPLISATGSTKMGQEVGCVVANRFGRSILELGGNNAITVSETADVQLALRAVLFGAFGTAGQRCTTTRRLLLPKKLKETFASSLVAACRQIKVGDPRLEGTLMGPMIDEGAVQDMMDSIEELKKQGGRVLYGGERVTVKGLEGGHYVTPCIAEGKNEFPVVQKETFAPLLYIIEYDGIEEAIALQNGVPQGLSSAVFTTDLREMELFLSPAGSDCGIANVNIGTSGAEIGGAFGGDKETGGGRESGSDAWKYYMRRQTCTVNGGRDLPLAQGVNSKIDL